MKFLKSEFSNTCEFSQYDINKFILMLQGVYPCEYMDDYQKLNETSLPEKNIFYSHLNMKDIIDADYMHKKRACKEYPDLYV